MKVSDAMNGMLGGVIRGLRRDIVIIGVFSMVVNVLMLTPTIYMLQLYDRVLFSRNELTLLVVTLLMVALFLVLGGAEFLRSRLLVDIGRKFDQELNSRVFHAAFSRYLRQAGTNQGQPFSDLSTIRQFISGNGMLAFFDIPWTPIYIGVTFLLHPILGCLALLFAGIQLVLTYLVNRSQYRSIEVVALAETESSGYIEAKMRNVEAVHVMGMVQHLKDRWFGLHDRFLNSNEVSGERQIRYEALTKFFRYSMQSLTLGAGALLVIDGSMTVGGMIAGNVLMARALQPLDLVIGTWRQFVEAKVVVGRLDTLLASYPERGEGKPVESLRGDVKVSSLSASAPERSEPILDDISIEFKPGQIIAVMGPSGSGKSTLARCLVGIWPEYSGEVALDGTPIDKLNRSQLGPFIGYVPQDIELLEGSVVENISRFREIEPDKVIEAARKAGIHEMILRFPQGYDTQIGVAGSMLSGGQRQRVALARAMYDEPSLLVLDEPNANLDDAGTMALNQALQTMKDAGSTVVIISHRPNILQISDRVLIMKGGRIVRDDDKKKALAIEKKSIAPPTVSIR